MPAFLIPTSKPQPLPLSTLATALIIAFSSQVSAVETTLPTIVVTGNPLARDVTTSAVSVLQGSALWLRQAGSLGETLDGLPGVSATSFGPAASRLIIRGLDGDRIRILQNGVTALDASALSFDHAVAQDTLGVERIEVLRGAAALQYGGSALGGVVNTIDQRIPRKPIKEASAQIDLQWGGASRERTAAALLETGNGKFALHADATTRKADDLRIPGFAWSARQRALHASELEEEHSPRGTLPNSHGSSLGGSVGGSLFWGDGFAGLAYADYRSEYGSIAEPDVRLDLRQQRWALASEVRNLSGPFAAIKLDASHTDYRHVELENGEVGTRFSNQGYEFSLEAQQRKLGDWSGVVGWQRSDTRFAALGDEAFVPRTQTSSDALYVVEELAISPDVSLNLGGRVERTSLTPDAQGKLRFVGANRSSFTASSFATGLLGKLDAAWSLGGNLSFTQRAPSFYELYANGEHVATGIVERGDPQATKEKARAIDLTLRYAANGNSASLSAYYSRFSNYIALQPTGRRCEADGEIDHCEIADSGTAEYRYGAMPAKIMGIELEGRTPVSRGSSGDVTLDWQADYTRANRSDTGEALPRIAPLRLAAGLSYRLGTLESRIGFKHASEQTRVPNNDTPSASYTTIHAGVSYWFNTGGSEWMFYLRGDNLTNREVRYATSLLREIAPQGGRALRVGVRGAF